jgi:chemotaxis protein CheD
MTVVMTKIGIAEVRAAKDPAVLVTLGLGSCVGVCLYDSKKKVIGMAHIMLPSSKEIKNNANKAKFADTAIDMLIEEMEAIGADRKSITAKIAGGAQMFSFKSSNEFLRTGERNVEAVRRELGRHRVEIVAEDVGGNYGRTIEFYSHDGSLSIRTIGHGTKVI